MAILDIVIHPDSRLRKKSEEVKELTDEIKKFILDLTETMYEKDGVGLAAPQVGVSKKIIVIDIKAPEKIEDRDPQVLINPKIVRKEGSAKNEEGCLSVPKIYDEVTRATKVVVEALDRNFQPITIEAEDIYAIALQHEIDHLNGKIFIDYLSPLKYQRITKKMKKYKKTIKTTKE